MIILKPINVHNPIDIIKEIKRIGDLYKKKKLKDFRIFQNMIFINDMDCLDALKLMHKTFNLNLTNGYKTLLRDYYIYFNYGCEIILPVSDLPFNVLTELYNHMYFEQDRMGRPIKVNEIEMFDFRGL